MPVPTYREGQRVIPPVLRERIEAYFPHISNAMTVDFAGGLHRRVEGVLWRTEEAEDLTLKVSEV